MEISQRDLFIDMVVDMFLSSKITNDALPLFRLLLKIGVGLPKPVFFFQFLPVFFLVEARSQTCKQKCLRRWFKVFKMECFYFSYK